MGITKNSIEKLKFIIFLAVLMILSMVFSTSVFAADAPILERVATNGDGSAIILTFDKEMADPTGKHGQFTATVTEAVYFSGAALDDDNNKRIILTVDGASFEPVNDITVSYEMGDVADSDGESLGTIANETVANAVFTSGSGITGDPYIISNEDQLDAVRYHLDKYFLLGADINLGVSPYNTGEGWEPIGTSSNPFTGTFDGDGHTITGLYIERPNTDDVGLFGCVNGSIVDVGLDNINITGHNYVGGITGYNKGTGATIDSSYASGTVSSSGIYVGGLVGRNEGDINQSYAEGSVAGNITSSQYVGGLVGVNAYSAITDSYAENDVEGYSNVGGLAGLNQSGGMIDNSYATGNVSGRDLYVGGLVAQNAAGTITNSYAEGNVNNTGNSSGTGGLVGANWGAISNSYAGGAVEGNSYVGGLVGRNGSSSYSATVENCYASGMVEGTWDFVGGLVGHLTKGSVSSCFALNPEIVSASGNTYTNYGRITGYVETSHSPVLSKNWANALMNYPFEEAFTEMTHNGKDGADLYEWDLTGGVLTYTLPLADNTTVWPASPESPKMDQNFTFTVQVRDGAGNHIDGLEPSDFAVTENGSGDLTIESIAEENPGHYTITACHNTAETITITVSVLGVDVGRIENMQVTAEAQEPPADVSIVTTRINGIDGAEPDDYSSYVALSGTGRYIAFESRANNLAAGDTENPFDVFVYDRESDMVEMISGSLDIGYDPDISADGGTVVFGSDVDGSYGIIHVWNRGSGSINRLTDENGDDVRCQGRPFISNDGQYIVYTSRTSSKIYRYDLMSGINQEITEGSNPSISGDGQYIAYQKKENGDWRVYVYDTATSTETRVDISSSGEGAVGGSSYPHISGDGRFISFESFAKNLTDDVGIYGEDIYVHDRDADGDGIFDELGKIATILVSKSSTGVPGNGYSGETNGEGAEISDCGRYVMFLSSADNLVPGDTNDTEDLFVRDIKEGQTIRVNVSSEGDQIENGADIYYPAMSGDGCVVAYVSESENLVSESSTTNHVYISEIQWGDSTPIPVTIGGITTNNKTYDGTTYAPTGTVTVTGGSVPVGQLEWLYESTDGGSYHSSIAPTNAGSYKLTISVPDSNADYTGSEVFIFTIEKRQITLAADNKTVVKGASLPALTYTVENLPTGKTKADALSTEPVLACPAFDGNTSSDYDITLTGGTATDNYTITTRTNGTLTVAERAYTVTFHNNGSVYTTKTVIAGQSIESANWPAAPTRSSYTFGGWFTGENGSGSQFTASTPVNATITVYAKWTYKGGSSSSGGGGGSSSPATPTYKAEVKAENGTEKTLSVKVDKDAGTASIDANSQSFAQGETVITIPSIPDVDTYSVGIPVPELSTTGEQGTLTLETDISNITVPSNMLTGVAGISGSKAQITIGQGDKDTLPGEVKAAIGDRPLIQLTLSIDGRQTDWSNPSAPVTVSIPYTPTAEELANQEHITVWYIDGKGNVLEVPSGRYDPTTGMVTFSTTHFSNYAVAYVHKTFSDLGRVEWARKPVEVLASKGILKGISETEYAPQDNITRADFLYFLVRTLGVDAKIDGSFDDISRDAYYYKEIAVAKKLGITSGTGNNKFSPDASITRQDMMVLTEKSLRMLNRLEAQGMASDLDKFADKSLVAAYAVNGVASVVKEGLIVGSNANVNPLGNTTRAEAAVFLYRIYNKYPEAPVNTASTL